ncbi:hypothetical protein D3C76_1035340 [compost metagenome]
MLPAMIVFVMFMASLIQIAAAEVALRSAVSETAKSTAAHWEPVRMVYREAKDQVMSTTPGQWAGKMADKLMNARTGWEEAEDWVMKYESLFPDMVGVLVQWEINKRESLEKQGIDAVNTTVRKAVDPLLCKTFEPILRHYANGKLLKANSLSVEAVKLPSLEEGGDASVMITAGYKLKLPVPFWNKTLYLEKTAVERAWVGEE